MHGSLSKTDNDYYRIFSPLIVCDTSLPCLFSNFAVARQSLLSTILRKDFPISNLRIPNTTH